MATYWDTSCVVKLYCLDSDSDWYLVAIAAEAEPLRSSRLLEAELFFAFRIKWARGETGSESPEDLFGLFLNDVEHERFLLFPIGCDVLDESSKVAQTCFASQPTVPLRTLDGLGKNGHPPEVIRAPRFSVHIFHRRCNGVGQGGSSRGGPDQSPGATHP